MRKMDFGIHILIPFLIILLIADIFIQSEILSYTALLILTAYISFFIEATILWKCILVFLIFIGILVIYYYIWRRLVRLVLYNKSYDLNHNEHLGSELKIQERDGNHYVSIRDEYFKILPDGEDFFSDGKVVRITSFSRGCYYGKIKK